jgi:hypothetical protein
VSSSRTGTVSASLPTVYLPEQHVDDAVAMCLTGQPELDNAANGIAPVRPSSRPIRC